MRCNLMSELIRSFISCRSLSKKIRTKERGRIGKSERRCLTAHFQPPNGGMKVINFDRRLGGIKNGCWAMKS